MGSILYVTHNFLYNKPFLRKSINLTCAQIKVGHELKLNSLGDY